MVAIAVYVGFVAEFLGFHEDAHFVARIVNHVDVHKNVVVLVYDSLDFSSCNNIAAFFEGVLKW